MTLEEKTNFNIDKEENSSKLNIINLNVIAQTAHYIFHEVLKIKLKLTKQNRINFSFGSCAY